MSLTNGPNLGLLVDGAAGEEHYDELMAQWRGFDLLVQARVLDKDLAAPPGAPADGDAYIVAAGASGAWAGNAGKIARWSTALSPDAWEFFTPKSGWECYVVDETYMYRYSGSAWARSERLQVIAVACSDETTTITAGTAKVKFRMPYAFTLFDVRGSLTTAQSSGSIFTVDINEAGATILSTKLTIDNTELTSTTAATAVVMSDTSLANDAEISIDVDQVGSGTAAGLKVYLIGRPT
jgi:hypothetical protein